MKEEKEKIRAKHQDKIEKNKFTVKGAGMAKGLL